MSLTTLLSLVGDIVTVGGAILNLTNSPDRSSVERYINFLETRRVLFAQFDQEIKHAVIKSMEEIKHETESLRASVSEPNIKKLLLKSINIIQHELDNLWAYDTIHRKGQMKMFMSIQRFRADMAHTLAKLCHVYGIDPESTELKEFIISMATVRPSSKVAQ